MTLVIYDTETTGINPAFDQILQIAALKTDGDLNEVDQFETRSRLLPHIIPAPGALRVTGVPIERATDASLRSHYDMIRETRAEFLKWSPATFLGYNSIRFDEQLLRQALFQTLHPPYLTNTNGNKRGDVLPLIQAASFLAPGAITVPTLAGGPTFKLDQIAPANGITHHNAHDALGDVQATLKLCRRVRDKVPELWSNFLRFSQKAAAGAFLEHEAAFVAIEFYFNRPYTYALSTIGYEADQPGTALAVDHAVNLAELRTLSETDLIARMNQKRAPKPVRRVKLNAPPTLLRLDDMPSHACERLPASDVIDRQLALLNSDPEFVHRLIAAHMATRTEFEPSAYVEERIYDGFVGRADEALMAAFHAVPWDERPAILGRIEDPRVRELGRRLIYFESPVSLSKEDHAAVEQEIAAKLLAPPELGAPWLTLPMAIAQTSEMLAEANHGEKPILVGFHEFLLARLALLQNKAA